MRGLAVTLVIACIAPVGCTQDITWRAVDRMIEANYPSVSTITPDSLAERLADSTAPRPLLLDARSPEEYAVSHLPGAQRIDPEATSFPALDTLDRRTPIVVYCSVGYRSARIASRLGDAGFEQVSNLRGSIFRWANEGRTVVRDGHPVRAVHPYSRAWGTLLNADLRSYTPGDTTTQK